MVVWRMSEHCSHSDYQTIILDIPEATIKSFLEVQKLKILTDEADFIKSINF